MVDPDTTAKTPMRPRRFKSITRTVNRFGSHTLDAICEEGRAWWLIVGDDEAPEVWTELLPLPDAEARP
jgi:hypothetical protein